MACLSRKSDEPIQTALDMPAAPCLPAGRAQRSMSLAADRIKYPMKRKNWEPGGGKKELRGKDEWVRISWEEALDITASETKRIYDKYGPATCLPLSWAGWSAVAAVKVTPCGTRMPRVFAAMGGYTCQWGIVSWGAWILPELFMSGQVWAASDRMSLLQCQVDRPVRCTTGRRTRAAILHIMS